MTIITTIIRWILTALLIYGIYTETGIWTVLFATLIIIEIELDALLTKLTKDELP